jgi:hypothetical protein
VLFRLGTIYLHRFEDFSHCTHRDEKADLEATEWRNAQQAEWNSLATLVSHLSTFYLSHAEANSPHSHRAARLAWHHKCSDHQISSECGGAAVSLWPDCPYVACSHFAPVLISNTPLLSHRSPSRRTMANTTATHTRGFQTFSPLVACAILKCGNVKMANPSATSSIVSSAPDNQCHPMST